MKLGRLLDDRIAMKHGAGGRAMRTLIEQVCLPGAGPGLAGGIGLAAMDDGAALKIGDRWLVVTTDSHVVKPIFFPGGDIGRLAVSGTVNDLAMMGATEVTALTCAVIVEEGFLRADLERVYRSIREACAEAGAEVVTGDTKVMGKGEIDGLVLNTAGIGVHGPGRLRRGLEARRPNHRDRHDRRPRHGDHGGAARARPRGRPAVRRRADQRPRPARRSMRAARSGGDEGPDAGRPVERPARDGGEGRRRRPARASRPCRFGPRCARRPTCWGSTR